MKTSLEFARDTLIVIESIASGSTTANSLPNLARIAREGLTAIENSDSKSAATEASGATAPDADAKDAARLMFAMQDFDGFVGVKKDKYDFAIECAEENGRDEPTSEDEINGVRRLIDAAIAAAPAAPEQTEGK